MHADIKTHTQ